jgi:hypothetical protein
LIGLIGFNGLGHSVHNSGEHTPHPLLRSSHETEKLIGIDRFWINNLGSGFISSVGLLLSETLPYSGLTRTWWADDEHTMPDDQDIFGLDDLQDETFFAVLGLVTEFSGSGTDLLDKGSVDLLDHVKSWEEIGDQTLENWLIVDGNLSDVKLF